MNEYKHLNPPKEPHEVIPTVWTLLYLGGKKILMCKHCKRQAIGPNIDKLTDKGVWQHSTPQRDLDHIVFPQRYKRRKGRQKGQVAYYCKACRKAVRWFPSNEGPESLKSFFRF